MSGDLTLFVDAYWCSPFDFSCFVALREKGLEFSSSRAIMRAGQGLPATYADRTLVARVPALAHGDFWLSESLAVVEYLEDAFPPPDWPRLWPADLRARARSRQLMSFVRSELGALRNERSSWRVVYPSATPLPPLGPQARAEADELIAVTTRLLGTPELTGWSLAGADLAFALLRLIRTGEVVPAPVQAFAAEMCERPSVRDYLLHSRPPNAPSDR